MERVRDVLYVERHLTGSSRGFSCASEVARVHRARLTVTGVVPDPGPTDGRRPLTAGEAQRQEARQRRWCRRLEALAGRGAIDGLPAPVRVLHGDLCDAVLEEVSREGHDLVMTVAETGGLPGPWRLDGSDRRLLRLCPCPVWMLDPAQGSGLRVVLAAVDVGPGRQPELNGRIVALAASLAAAAGADLHVVHAWSVVGEPILASAITGVSKARLRDLLASTRRERRERVERLLAREAPDRRASVSLPKGDAVWAVRHEARCSEADVVVVGNAGRTGVEALLFGNLAERLVGCVPGSVLSVPGGRPGALRSGPRAGGLVETVAAGRAGGAA